MSLIHENYPAGVDVYDEYEGDGPYSEAATIYCPTCHWSGDDDQVTVGVLVDGDREILQPERCPQCGSQQLFSVN